MFDKILVVCIGNICRSPYGACSLQARLPNKHIASAGISVAKNNLLGKPATHQAIVVSKALGIDLNQHQSQQLTSELCAQYDLILIMEKDHMTALTDIAPEARGKAMLFGKWIGEKDIPDPYGQSREAYEYVYQLINHAVDAWVLRL